MVEKHYGNKKLQSMSDSVMWTKVEWAHGRVRLRYTAHLKINEVPHIYTM